MLLDPLQARAVYDLAARERFAILAVNADSPACIVDVLEAARLAQAPVIVETSLWQLKGHSFGAGDALRGLARYLADISVLAEDPAYADVPVIFHTDHIKGPETVRIISAAISGLPLRNQGSTAILRASSISLDASELSEEQNIDTLAALIRHAQAHGVPVTCEMEAGVDDGITETAVIARLVGGLERRHPGHLALFAPGIGSQHGFSAGGFPTFSPAAVGRAKQIIEEICGRPMGVALHGSTGLGEEQIRAAVAAGVTKVNWSSESLLVRATAARGYWRDHGEDIDPQQRAFKATAMDNGVQSAVSQAYVPVVRARMAAVGATARGPQCLHAARACAALAGAAP
ncbi:MAG: class II fructose-bisphosphate aldolase [Planctomycetes bacterium]|nr:class II fructose-bisphosphate aldolase [Planctomycetota bacterium]